MKANLALRECGGTIQRTKEEFEARIQSKVGRSVLCSHTSKHFIDGFSLTHTPKPRYASIAMLSATSVGWSTSNFEDGIATTQKQYNTISIIKGCDLSLDRTIFKVKRSRVVSHTAKAEAKALEDAACQPHNSPGVDRFWSTIVAHSRVL